MERTRRLRGSSPVTKLGGGGSKLAGWWQRAAVEFGSQRWWDWSEEAGGLGPKIGAVEDCEGTSTFYRPAEGGERLGEVVKWSVVVSAPLIMMVLKGNGGVGVV
jgi:hypothetical protein